MKVALVLLLAGVVASGGDRGTAAKDQSDLLIVGGRHLSVEEIRELALRGYPSIPDLLKRPLAQAERQRIEAEFDEAGDRYFAALTYLGRHGQSEDLDLLEGIAARADYGGAELAASLLAEAGRPRRFLEIARGARNCSKAMRLAGQLLQLGIPEGVAIWFGAYDPERFTAATCANEINLVYAPRIAELSLLLPDFDYLAEVSGLWQRDPETFGKLVVGLYRKGASVESLRTKSCFALGEIASSEDWPELAKEAQIEMGRACVGQRSAPVEAQDRHGSEPTWKSVASRLEERGISSSPEGARAFLAAAAANASGLTMKDALLASSVAFLVDLRRDPGSCGPLWLLARDSGSSILRTRAAKALCHLGDTERGRDALLHELLDVEKRVMGAGGDSARRSAEMVVTDLAEEILRCGGPDLLDRLIRQYLDPDYTVSVRARTALRRLVAERVLEPQQLQLLVDPVARALRRRPEGGDVNLAGLLVFFDIVARDHFMEIVAPLANSSDKDVKREVDTYLAGGPKLVPVELIGPRPVPVCGGGG